MRLSEYRNCRGAPSDPVLRAGFPPTTEPITITFVEDKEENILKTLRYQRQRRIG